MVISNKMDLTVNIFTLNCWGIPVISKNRKERIEAISKYLIKSSHNIVCLQEIWSEKDYLYLRDSLQSILPYSHYFYSGVLGSGLCVFSKWLIQDVFFHQWPLNGYIHKIHHGDWFGGKGVGLCRIKCNHRLINVYCTHLHAEYDDDDIYLAHRVLQAYSTAEFIKLTKYSADISILAGDLNTAPGDLSFRIISKLPALLDPFDLSCEQTNPNIARATGTSENINNSYSGVQRTATCPEGKRIDHILFSINNTSQVHVLNFGNPLEDRVPGQPFSYSDHNAVCLELKLSPKEKRMYETEQSIDETIVDIIQEAKKVYKDAMVIISKSKTLNLIVGGLLFMFLLGTVGFWPNYVIYDVIKLIMTAICIYYLAMGTLWHRIEMNSLKAGISSLDNFCRSQK